MAQSIYTSFATFATLTPVSAGLYTFKDLAFADLASGVTFTSKQIAGKIAFKRADFYMTFVGFVNKGTATTTVSPLRASYTNADF